jgi:hypothetical protein
MLFALARRLGQEVKPDDRLRSLTLLGLEILPFHHQKKSAFRIFERREYSEKK